jgi:intracellular sulfur oxidation DsrE/DsrF family protein
MHDLAGNGSIIQTVMTQTWELLTEKQKKEVTVMRMDKAIKFLEMKISDMEKMSEIKKEVITNIRKVKEMLKQ